MVIVANILAPISILFNKQEGITAKINEAQAIGGSIVVTHPADTNSTITVKAVVTWNNMEPVQVVKIELVDITGDQYAKTASFESDSSDGIDNIGAKTSTVEKKFYSGSTVIMPGRKFKILVSAWQKKDMDDQENIANSVISAAAEEVRILTQDEQEEKDTGVPSNLPECSLTGGFFGDSGTWTGCLLQSFYYMIYMPTSWLFAKSGQFFDSMFAYSIADSSYRNAFVVEGWGILRDMSNVFFIFILLYVAFATVLNIHGVKTKEMIINVVIIGLLINFSLFATQVIVDTSNILARVFYNSQTLRTKTTVGNENTAQSGLNEISLSQGLVAKVDPQKIVRTQTAVHIEPTTSANLQKTGGVTATKEVDNTDWFIVILMASAINVVGIIVFLSLAIFCIARVIGLWVSMVLVPVAFFSYTVPAMQNIDTVGWQKWWPETIKLAFMAPILMFFLYIILVFLEKGFVGADVSGNDILAVIIPFVFIMMFLWKAKDIAKKLSGEMGGAVMKAAGTLGGLAMGGGALLGAATIGRVANKLGKSDTLNNWVAGRNKDGTVQNKNLLNSFRQKAAIIAKKGTNAGAKGSFDFRQTGAGNLLSSGVGLDLNKYTNFAGLSTKNTVGGYVAKEQKKVEKEEKFAKTLGYDHHLMEHTDDEISDKEAEVAKSKLNQTIAGRQETARLKNELATLQKNKGRIEKGREKDYHLYKKRQSGKLFTEHIEERDSHGEVKIGTDGKPIVIQQGNVFRDANYNIKKIGHGIDDAAQGARQIGYEALEGFAKGAGAVMASAAWAGAAAIVPAVAVGIINAIRQAAFQYSGTTNLKVGADHNHVEKFEDTYKAPAADHGAGDHGGGDHGGGGHGGGDHGGGDHGGGGHK